LFSDKSKPVQVNRKRIYHTRISFHLQQRTNRFDLMDVSTSSADAVVFSLPILCTVFVVYHLGIYWCLLCVFLFVTVTCHPFYDRKIPVQLLYTYYTLETSVKVVDFVSPAGAAAAVTEPPLSVETCSFVKGETS
jgi:hypothetical protein